MKLGQVLQIAEYIMVVYCGIRVAVGPNPMRWDKKYVKIIFRLIVLFGLGLQIANTFFYKFSESGILIHSVFIFVILYIFYYMDFWELFAHNFLYWLTYMLTRYLILYIGCYYNSVPLYRYIGTKYNEQWGKLHMASMFVTIIIAIWLLRIQKKKEKPLIVCRSKADYKKIAVLVVIEELANELLFDSQIAYMDINNTALFLIIFVLWSLFCTAIIVAVLTAYLQGKNQNQVLELNYSLLQKQYELLQNIYCDNKRELHEQEQFTGMVKELLKEGDIEHAIQYLDERETCTSNKQKNKYTGIDVIDFILGYKLREAKQYNIQVKVDVDIFSCPLEATDMCILLGNLLDNAIEATKDLDRNKRFINIKMRNPNRIFIIEISNPYDGDRKKKEGRYLTTKTDTISHGFGLDNVEKIAQKLNGEVEIEDINNTFKIIVALFDRKRTKKQSLETF